MQFGEVDTHDAKGCLLVHSLRLPGGRLSKGTLLTEEHIIALAAEGIDRVTVVRLAEDDLLEDEAAAAIAAAVPQINFCTTEAATGRVNLHATAEGLFVADRTLVDALNRLDPAITIATLADHASVRSGDMVATVKIIPLAVPQAAVVRAVSLLKEDIPFQVKPYRRHRVLLIATELPSLKGSVMDRTAMLLQRRLDPSGSKVTEEVRIPHDERMLTEALCRGMAAGERPDLIIVFGASAVSDPQDVIPAAIRAAGGDVEHVGMPVDPGNLLVLGRLQDIPVIGAPGCARSPKENGFDWVLSRILAGEKPTAQDITGMGVGGLLMEIASRPQPREASAVTEEAPARVGAVLLAAGQARRMGQGAPHKLLAEFEGVPLVRRSAEMLCRSQAQPVVVVTGHRRHEIDTALSGLDVTLVFNPDYATGLGGSLATGFSLPQVGECQGVLVMLADMPQVTADHVDRLIEAFRQTDAASVVRASHNGKRGNPIILPRATYEAVRRLQGDVGARAIIENSGLPIIDVEIGPAAHLDVDTPDAVQAAGGVLRG
ncbi:molybdenum cofactor cytidylyltransferase [Pseudorhizobium tarimense]|uniref:Molybdenum cofactor cytidylyltransferase n=1 Tax=Pseudorhizobium tarimense TaxID=1079109 RepID=A0ABV2H3E4_9HYPH|nr:molybdopterin-binding/glycosyltransferase family 2 protein [Pseudorhizobium tarimense]MCJ8518206.1 molybdopterin-binding/glycosyltransferase family 2 protein [Pseudorhizobium tarimense]